MCRSSCSGLRGRGASRGFAKAGERRATDRRGRSSPFQARCPLQWRWGPPVLARLLVLGLGLLVAAQAAAEQGYIWRFAYNTTQGADAADACARALPGYFGGNARLCATGARDADSYWCHLDRDDGQGCRQTDSYAFRDLMSCPAGEVPLWSGEFWACAPPSSSVVAAYYPHLPWYPPLYATVQGACEAGWAYGFAARGYYDAGWDEARGLVDTLSYGLGEYGCRAYYRDGRGPFEAMPVHTFTAICPPGQALDYLSAQCAPAGPTACDPLTEVWDPLGKRCTDQALASRTVGAPERGALCVGNPVHPQSGNKYQVAQDYAGSGALALRFTRYYNSDAAAAAGSLGARWRHGYERGIRTETDAGVRSALLTRPDGKTLHFYTLGDGTWRSTPDVTLRLAEQVDAAGATRGWTVTGDDDSVETYDAAGRLTALSRRDGLTQSLAYGVPALEGGDDDPETLDTVTGPFGRTLRLGYDSAGRLATLTDPAGQVYRYAYDAQANLVAVAYPDETPGDASDNPTRSYRYEDSRFPHALTGIVDANGSRFATWAYDDQGRAILSEHADGAERVALTYNADGTTTVSDGLGKTSTYGFAVRYGQVRPAAISGPCASCGRQAADYRYDGHGFLASRTDFNGHTTQYGHDARGLELSRTEAVGTPVERTVTTQWHADLRLPVKVTEPGKETTFSYDGAGRLLSRSESDPASGAARTWNSRYNAQGLLATVDGPRTDVADVTAYAYDAQGNRISTTNALGHVTRITSHDAHGRPLVIEDANGITTTLAYDARGRLLSRDVAGALSGFTYDAVGNLTRLTLADGSTLDYGYDAAHRRVAVADNLGNRIAYTLDALGNRIEEQVTDPAGALTRTRARVYDSLNRLREDIGGEGQRWAYAYDAEGNRTSATDPNQHTTTYGYDALNRLVTALDPASGETRYGYDAQNNLTAVTDPRGNTTTYGYDGLGNQTQLTSPDSGLTTSGYDAAGNRIRQTDARGITATYTYDALNRLTAIHYPDPAEDVSFTYDAGPNGIGRLSGITDPSGTTTYTYDERGNRLQETRTMDGTRYVTAYAYDAADKLTAITYPSGRQVTYPRDGAGRIVAVTLTHAGESTTLASDIRYLPFGPLVSLTFGNGLTLTRSFDADYRLITQQTGSATSRLQDLVYSLDAADNLLAIANTLDPERNQSFVYDALDRLTEAMGLYGHYGYAYDALGNRVSKTENDVVDDYAVDRTSNRLSTLNDAEPTTFSYDNAGNTVQAGELTYTYAQNNRLIAAARGEETLAEYAYNANGERVRKVTAAGITHFHYDPTGNLIAESDADGEMLREYVYLEGLRLALVVHQTGSPTPGEPLVLDNGAPEVSFLGTWPHSTVVSGYAGADYQYHAPNGDPPGGLIVDNTDAGFATTGTWPHSRVVAGFAGTGYQHHYANGDPPGGAVVDNGDAATAVFGTWKLSTSVGGYLGANYAAHAAGTGENRFTWTLTPSADGAQDLYARWTAHPNRATDATYVIAQGDEETPVTVSQQANGGRWVRLASVTASAGEPITVTLSDAANGYVIADAVKLIAADAPPNTATWTLPVESAGRYAVYARWTAHANRATDATYTVHHAGGQTPVTVNQQQHGGSWQPLGSFDFEPGEARISLTDQANGYVIADAIKLVAADAPPNQVTWQPDLPAGEYAVSARWTAHPNRATNATYTVHHAGGGTEVIVNQQQHGGSWQPLGTYTFLSGQARITLTDQADGYVIADALRFEPLTVTTPQQAGLYYLHTDHLGTPQLLTDASQQVVWQADYAPFGEATVTTAAINNPLRFPGQYFDPETGLHYNYFRDYDPGTGRYIEADPLGVPAISNLYSYVTGNPANRVDPLGLIEWRGRFDIKNFTAGIVSRYEGNFVLTPGCIDGQEITLFIDVKGYGFDVGLPPTGGQIRGKVVLEDHKDYVDTAALEGRFSVSSAGAVVGPVDISLTHIALGNALSKKVSSAGLSIGLSSTVTGEAVRADMRIKPCQCMDN